MRLFAGRYHVFVPDQLRCSKTQKVYDFGKGARAQKIEHLAAWMKALAITDAHMVGNSA